MAEAGVFFIVDVMNRNYLLHPRKGKEKKWFFNMGTME